MKRKPDESFEDYKIRRKSDQKATKEALKPKIIWNSVLKGTYRKNVNTTAVY